MKKLLSIATALLTLSACSSSEEPQQPKEMVEFSLNYDFADKGDMARSAGSDAYATFYNNQIKTKKLTPQHFNLVFTDANGATYTLNSRWDLNTKFNLLEGEYTVTGTSNPVYQKTIDTLSIKFDEKITISKENPNISLTAINNCYLLLFGADDITSVKQKAKFKDKPYTVDSELNKTDNLYYSFNRKNSSWYEYGITISYSNGSTNVINLLKIPFEHGKYYYFNTFTNSFSVPAMEEGK